VGAGFELQQIPLDIIADPPLLIIVNPLSASVKETPDIGIVETNGKVAAIVVKENSFP